MQNTWFFNVFSMFFIIPHLRALSENHLTIVRNTLFERVERPIAFDKRVFCIPDPQNGRRRLSGTFLEAPLATFLALLRALGRSWARLGRSWDTLGALLGCLGELLRRSWDDHGTLWGVHETIWGALGGFLGLHWTLWGAFQASWVDLG